MSEEEMEKCVTPMKSFRADDVTDSMPLFRSGGGGAIPTSALQLEIARCNVHRACELNARWHSRLPLLDWSSVVRHRHYVCYVAEVDAIAYAVGIWSEPSGANRMKDGDKLMELRRLAIGENAPKNTASRMLRVMKNMILKEFPQIIRLISYQDTEAHTGGIYKAAGWNAASENEFRPWLHNRATPELTQTRAKKVRWEYPLSQEELRDAAAGCRVAAACLDDGDERIARPVELADEINEMQLELWKEDA